MADPIIWPYCLMPRECAVNMAPRTLSGGASLNGFNQAVSTPAGLWRIEYNGVPCNTPDRILAWRAVAAQAEGRANALLVPCYDNRDLTPQPNKGRVTHSDGTSFSDGAPYLSPGVEIRTAASYAVGVTTMSISNLSNTPVNAGQHFSIGERLYRVSYLNTATSFKFWPPLREAVASGDWLEFARPVCKVRLAADDGMDLSLLISRLGTGNVSFIEDPN